MPSLQPAKYATAGSVNVLVGVRKVEPTRTLAGVAGAVPVPPVPAEYVMHAPCPVTTGIPFHTFGGLVRANLAALGVM